MIPCWFLLMFFHTFMGPLKDKGHIDLVFVSSVDYTIERDGEVSPGVDKGPFMRELRKPR